MGGVAAWQVGAWLMGSANFHQFEFENKNGIGRDVFPSPASAVGEFGGDGQFP